jgi:tRNA threonylcarbamoyladenosine biosynthesis protein TsaB
LETPLVLAIDTSSQNTGIIIQGAGVYETQRFAPPIRAGERLAPAIEEMMSRNSLSFNDLALMAMVIGPGSFTGLRVGLALSKGLVFGRDLPLVGINSLDVLAAQAPLQNGLVLPVMEARRNEVYTGLYQKSAEACNRKGEFLRLSHEEFYRLPAEEALVIGPAIDRMNIEADSINSFMQFAEKANNGLSLEWLVQLALQEFNRSGGVDPLSLEPLYLQPFIPTQAKNKLEKGK